jgi:hypothetical protein
MNIKEKYNLACGTPSDIYQHLPILRAYASRCEHITEMGVRTVVSTWAFLDARPKKLVGYDISMHPNVDEALDFASKENIRYEFYENDVLKVKIEPTDFLFIDTFHTASQLEKELKLHAKKAKKYIGFHDTHTYWETGEQPYEGTGGKGLDCGRGLKFALEPFLKNNPEWVIDYQTDINNGLTIIKRV